MIHIKIVTALDEEHQWHRVGDALDLKNCAIEFITYNLCVSSLVDKAPQTSPFCAIATDGGYDIYISNRLHNIKLYDNKYTYLKNIIDAMQMAVSKNRIVHASMPYDKEMNFDEVFMDDRNSLYTVEEELSNQLMSLKNDCSEDTLIGQEYKELLWMLIIKLAFTPTAIRRDFLNGADFSFDHLLMTNDAFRNFFLSPKARQKLGLYINGIELAFKGEEINQVTHRYKKYCKLYDMHCDVERLEKQSVLSKNIDYLIRLLRENIDGAAEQFSTLSTNALYTHRTKQTELTERILAIKPLISIIETNIQALESHYKSNVEALIRVSVSLITDTLSRQAVEDLEMTLGGLHQLIKVLEHTHAWCSESQLSAPQKIESVATRLRNSSRSEFCEIVIDLQSILAEINEHRNKNALIQDIAKTLETFDLDEVSKIYQMVNRPSQLSSPFQPVGNQRGRFFTTVSGPHDDMYSPIKPLACRDNPQAQAVTKQEQPQRTGNGLT